MTDLIRRKLNWASLSRLEKLTLTTSILIWGGVILFGSGLYVAFRNHSVEQQALAQAPDPVASSTKPPTSTATTEAFPVGWATATATVTPVPTHTPTAVVERTAPARESGPSTAVDPATPASVEPTPLSVQPASAGSGLIPPPAAAPPDRIVISQIELDSSIVPIGWYVIEQDEHRYSIWQVADYAVSWHKTSAYPGHSGNIVLNGHHNIKGEVFRYLVDVEAGDRVLLYVGDQVYHYEVEQKMILKEKGEPPEVRRENASWIAPTDGERLTMVTCWPYTNNTHRLVVVARPVPPPPSEGLAE